MEDKPQCPFGHSSNPFDDTAHNENQRLEELWNDLLAKLKAEGRDPRRPLDSLKEETEATNTASSEQEEHQDGSLPLDLPPRVWVSATHTSDPQFNNVQYVCQTDNSQVFRLLNLFDVETYHTINNTALLRYCHEWHSKGRLQPNPDLPNGYY